MIGRLDPTWGVDLSRDYDRAVELEAAGGQLLNLSRNDWSEILEAA